jgi:hypothetical protein
VSRGPYDDFFLDGVKGQDVLISYASMLDGSLNSAGRLRWAAEKT